MKKMNKKGFTLIELLAIIVILAIIAVITVPIILNIIDDAKKGAEKNSVIGYGKAVELAYTQYQYKQQLSPDDNDFIGTSAGVADGSSISITIDDAEDAIYLKVDFDGDKVSCAGDNTIIDGKISLKECSVVNGSNTVYDYNEGKANEATSGSSEE